MESEIGRSIDNLPNQSERVSSEVVMDVPGQLCARARFWASLRMDGELSELEGVLLDAHLSGCADCRQVTAGFSLATENLPAAPPAPPRPGAPPPPPPPRRAL